jgi:hypothetical protein
MNRLGCDITHPLPASWSWRRPVPHRSLDACCPGVVCGRHSCGQESHPFTLPPRGATTVPAGPPLSQPASVAFGAPPSWEAAQLGGAVPPVHRKERGYRAGRPKPRRSSVILVENHPIEVLVTGSGWLALKRGVGALPHRCSRPARAVPQPDRRRVHAGNPYRNYIKFIKL